MIKIIFNPDNVHGWPRIRKAAHTSTGQNRERERCNMDETIILASTTIEQMHDLRLCHEIDKCNFNYDSCNFATSKRTQFHRQE